jgi:lysophospholipase L1-like esterase
MKTKLPDRAIGRVVGRLFGAMALLAASLVVVGTTTVAAAVSNTSGLAWTVCTNGNIDLNSEFINNSTTTYAVSVTTPYGNGPAQVVAPNTNSVFTAPTHSSRIAAGGLVTFTIALALSPSTIVGSETASFNALDCTSGVTITRTCTYVGGVIDQRVDTFNISPIAITGIGTGLVLMSGGQNTGTILSFAISVSPAVPGGVRNYAIEGYPPPFDMFVQGRGTVFVPPAPAGCSGTNYVALGDSYSSGEGVPNASGQFLPGTNVASPADRCHRSAYAYSQVVAGTVGFPPASATSFWACSGAIIADYYHANVNDHEPAQRSHLNSSVTLVSLTMGGNDVEFPYIMGACLTLVNCQNAVGPAITLLINSTEPRLRALYSQILTDAPNAQVYILGYPRIVAASPSLVCQASGLQASETTWIDSKVAQMDAAISQAISEVKNPRLHYVSTLHAFDGGEACSTSGSTGGSYMNGIVAGHPFYSFHPNRAGQVLLASALAHAVRGR